MEAILIPVVVMGITGILMGLFLAYASKKFEVEKDPKVEAILAILPGVNCGACGYPGCSGYATGVAQEGAKMTLCAPGGSKVAGKIGEIMGVEVEMPVKKKPVAKKPVEKKEVPKAPQTGDPITASPEFIEKNKRMLTKFKTAFDSGDKEAYEKLENLAKTANKEELLKYYEEIKTGKIIPEAGATPAPVVPSGDPITASPEFIEKNKRMLTKFKTAFDSGDKEAYEKLENLAKSAKKDELVKYYEEIKAGKIIPEGGVAVSTPVKEEVKVESKKEEAKQQEASYCSVLGDGLCVPEQNQKVKEELAKKEEKPKTPEEQEKEKQAAAYCSVLGDGLCVPEQNEEVQKDLSKAIDEEIK